MLVQMVRNCVAGMQARQAGAMVDVSPVEGEALIAMGAATLPPCVPPALASPIESATIQPPERAVGAPAQPKTTKVKP